MRDLDPLDGHGGLLKREVERSGLADQQLDVPLLCPVAQQDEAHAVGAGRQPDDGISALRRRDCAALLAGLPVQHRDLRGDERLAVRRRDTAVE